MTALELKIPPLLLTVMLACLMGAIAFATPSLSVGQGWTVWLGIVVMCVGAGICLAGVAAFRAARTTVDPTDPHAASALVRNGIYRYTRNPMYLGFLVALVGLAVMLANIIALLPALILVPWLNRFQIAPEEKALMQRFGHAFEAYRNDVRRWL